MTGFQGDDDDDDDDDDDAITFPSLPNTLWVDVWTPKHLFRRFLGGPITSSKGIWRILED